MILKIDLPIESRNKFEGRGWWKKNAYTKCWQQHLWAICNGKPPQATGPMGVKIKSFRERLLDEDNLSGGCKGILDAMKRLGMIVNDDPKHVKVTYSQERVKFVLRDKVKKYPCVKPHTIIEIYEIGKWR